MNTTSTTTSHEVEATVIGGGPAGATVSTSIANAAIAFGRSSASGASAFRSANHSSGRPDSLIGNLFDNSKSDVFSLPEAAPERAAAPAS